MNKTLLSGALIAATALSMSAAGELTLPAIDRNVRLFDNVAKPQVTTRARVQQTKDEEISDKYTEMFWGYTTTIYNATTMQVNGGDLCVAIQMPAEYTGLYAGAKVTKIMYPTGAARNSVNEIATNVTGWISEALDGAKITTKDATFSKQPGEWNTITLDTPYTITEGQSFCAGVTFRNMNANAMPIVFSLSTPYTDYGCYIGVEAGDQSQWISGGDQVGYLPLLVYLEGDNLPQNVLRLWGITAPSVAELGKNFTAGIVLQNLGAAPISSLGLSAWTVGSDEPAPNEINLGSAAIEAYPDVLSMQLSGVSATAVGDGYFSVSIPTVNGDANTLSDKISAITLQYVIPLGEGFTRYSVFEDATGTWCGYCPAAYAIMEDLRENYADQGFIGIGVHAAQGTQAPDPMDVAYKQGATYSGIFNYIQGFPTILMNREQSFNYTQPEEIYDALYNALNNERALIKIEAEIDASQSSGRILVNTRTTSGFDITGTRYLLSFVLTEDNVGPYAQTNYFSGENGNYGGFENQPNPCYLMFNDVARYCNTFSGLRNSLPATLEAGQTYEYSTRIGLTTVDNTDNYAVTVMAIDQITGAIANACRVYSPTKDGVETVSVDTDNIKVYGLTGSVRVEGTDAFEVYNLAGMRVNNTNLPAGTYIVRAAGKSVKTLVK